MQYRLTAGGRTGAEERSIDTEGMIDADTLSFLKLRLLSGGRRARAWGSVDGRAWTEIKTCDFDKPLLYQGIGVSAHGQDRGAKFLFLVRAQRPRPAFDQGMLIGGGDGDFGWCDWDKDRRWKVDGFWPVSVTEETELG